MQVSKGFYVHYKGGVYFVHGVGHDVDLKRDTVFYEGFLGTMWCRDVKEFTEKVDPVTGATGAKAERDGVPRFQRIVDWTVDGQPRVDGPNGLVVFVGRYRKDQ